MPDDKNTTNTSSPDPTKNNEGGVSSNTTPSISTEYFDIPPHPQVTQNQNINPSMDKTTNETPVNTPPVVDEIKSEPLAPPMPTTQVMGGTTDNSSGKDEVVLETPKKAETIKPKGRGKRILVPTILGILLLAGGLATGVILIRQNQDVREKAETPACTGCLDVNQNCIELGSTTNFQCGIGGELCVSCPTTQTCENGTCTPQATTAPVIPVQCLSVEAFTVDEDAGIEKASSWTKLIPNDLAKLTAGSYVYFTIAGKDTSGDIAKFTKARFKINNEPFVQVDAATNTKPAATSDTANEVKLYYKYKIPKGTTEFEVKAAIYHSDQEWIDLIEE